MPDAALMEGRKAGEEATATAAGPNVRTQEHGKKERRRREKSRPGTGQDKMGEEDGDK